MPRGSKPGERRGGRAKGTPNKLSATAREAIAFAAGHLGGPSRLGEWAKESPENETAFWTKIYPRLLPIEVHGAGPNGELTGTVTLNVSYTRENRPDEADQA